MTTDDLVCRLARRALAIIAPCLREEEQRDAFNEFCIAFQEELLWYKEQRERMRARRIGGEAQCGEETIPLSREVANGHCEKAEGWAVEP